MKCKNCEAIFSRNIRIDGKRYNLSSRKFCFTCSPWKAHNTKPDPTKPTIPKKWSELSAEIKEERKQRLLVRGRNRKQQLIDLKGGACQSCGYNKCMRAMTFHHRNPAEKKFEMTTREISGYSWENVLIEADKCDLLCANCHFEIEETLLRESRNQPQ